MTRIHDYKNEVENLKINWISNTLFITRNYKNSTLYRLMEDFKMTIEDIDSNKKIRQHILRSGIKCGFAQDRLFQAITK